MPAARKPNPKSQKQISNDQVDPYVFPETDESYGNPNIPSEFNQFTANKQSGVDFNRSEQMSFKGDTTKPFTIGLQDIDESIMFYFQNVIRPFVYQNGVRIEVPIIYGSPEKWKSVQKDGYYKDKNGAIMSPLIMFKRDTIDKNRSLTNKLDANAPHLYTSWRKPYNGKNSYSNFSVLTNRIPVDQFVVNVVPDYVTLTYSCTIQTYYIDQLNKIIDLGKEYGTTTGRKRLVNWLNFNRLLNAVRISGTNKLIINKCDILQELNIFKIRLDNELGPNFIKFNDFDNMKEYISRELKTYCDAVFSGDKENI